MLLTGLGVSLEARVGLFATIFLKQKGFSLPSLTQKKIQTFDNLLDYCPLYRKKSPSHLASRIPTKNFNYPLKKPKY